MAKLKKLVAAAVMLGALAAGPAMAGEAQIWSYWGTGAEANALKALMDVAAKEHPATTFTTRTITGNTAEMRQALQVALLGGNPPAVYQSGLGTDLKSFVDGSRLAPIDDIWAKVDGEKNFSDGVKRAVTFNGHVYGVPLNLHVISNVFYNKKLFDQLGLTPPKTMEEFQAVATKLEAAGYGALANASGPAWTFYELYPFIIDVYGIDGYYKLASGELPLDSPEMHKVFQNFTDTYVKHYMEGWSGYSWADAGAQMVAGKVAMYQMGDWLSSYLKDAGWKPGVDYDFFPAPAAKGAAVFQMDVLALIDVPNEDTRAAGKEFLTTALNPDGQVAFNVIKGSVAANLSAPKDVYDTYGQAAATELANASKDNAVLANFKFLVPVELANDWGNAINGYAIDPTPEKLDAMLKAVEAQRQQLVADGAFLKWY